MKKQQTQVTVLTMIADEGKAFTNYPAASILDCQVSTQLFVREDLSSVWREVDKEEADQILKMKEEALKAEQEKEQEKEQEDPNE